jgi:hypothetical protein
MRAKSHIFLLQKFQIEPSSDFTEKTITRVMNMEHKKDIRFKVLAVALVATPWIWRQIWYTFFIHGNHFNVAHLPFGEYIAVVYTILLSSMVTLTLLAISAIIVILAVFSYRRLQRIFSSITRSFGQFFSFVHLKS